MLVTLKWVPCGDYVHYSKRDSEVVLGDDVKQMQNGEEFLPIIKYEENVPESLLIYTIKGFGRIKKGHIQYNDCWYP